MVDKKTKKTVEKRTIEEKSKRAGYLFGRFLLVLILMAFNILVWSYIFFQVSITRQEAEYAKRVQIERRLEQIRKRKEVKAVQEVKEEPQLPKDTVAVVNGEPITLTQMQEMVAAVPQLAEVPFEEMYPNLLEMLINNTVIMKGAEEAGIPERPEIKRQLRNMKEQVVGQTYLDELLASKVTEEEIQARYEEEVKRFVREEEIHARHILLKTEKEAKDVLIQLRAGAKFNEVADKKSLDESTEGGDLGYFTKGMMIPEFGDVVFDMKKGDLSEPIKTPFGWHVVLVEDKRLVNPPKLEDVYDDLKRMVMETKLPSVMEEERARMQVQILVVPNPKEETDEVEIEEEIEDPEQNLVEG